MAKSTPNAAVPARFGSGQRPDQEGFPELADRLSQRLIKLQELINVLPGKVAVSVADPSDPYFKLELTRRGDEWNLAIETPTPDGPETELVADASLELKAQAAVLVPALLEELFKEVRRRAELLRTAHAALDSASQLFKQFESEGL